MKKDFIATDVEKVIDNGFCVGCGGCAAIDSGIKMRFKDTGIYEPNINAVSNPKIDEVCPFSNKGPNENELANHSYDKSDEDKLGTYLALKAGFDLNNDRRLKSSSGGGASWLLTQLFEEGHIDKVIHVKESQEQGKLFQYSVSSSAKEINQGVKTRYYPIEISEVIEFVKTCNGKYAFVGVPCFIKTIKRLSLVDQVIADRIIFTISIFCGHLKSAAFGESLAWQLGVKPEKIKKIDFRHKLMNSPANQYGVKVIDGESNIYTSPMQKLLGKDWGMGAFRLKACDFCDDIVGELADVSFGDAWLDKYKSDSKGTNLIIIRNKTIKNIFDKGMRENTFYTEDICSSEVVKSQDASFRHRRNGVKYRAKKYDKEARWYPIKRSFSGLEDPSLFDKINWEFRAWYSQKSHLVFLEAKRRKSLKIYIYFVKLNEFVASFLQKLNRLYRVSRNLKL